jgi:hypothetical protein
MSLFLRNHAMKIAGAAVSLIAACGPASAFTVSDLTAPAGPIKPTIAVYHEGLDAPKLDKVWWRRWGWGGPGLFFGGLAAGAVVGGALAAPYYYGGPGYYGGYGGPYYGGPYYPGCWRSVWTNYGWRRAWVC